MFSIYSKKQDVIYGGGRGGGGVVARCQQWVDVSNVRNYVLQCIVGVLCKSLGSHLDKTAAAQIPHLSFSFVLDLPDSIYVSGVFLTDRYKFN